MRESSRGWTTTAPLRRRRGVAVPRPRRRRSRRWRARIASSPRAAPWTSLVSAALDAFDGRIARAVAHDAPALGGFEDATEAQLLKRNHGAALSNLLAFARATAVARSRLAVDVASSPHGARVHETTGEGGEGGPGAALELMLLFPRAERTRAALLAHYSDELTRCLDGIDGASREGTRLAGDDPRTAVAVGAVFWLSRRLDVRGTDAKPTRRRSTRSSAC